jgi:hypothetical protein
VEVDAAARDRELRHFEYEAAWFDLDAPYDRLRSLTARLGVPFIYPRESFLDVEQHERLFFPRDGHPNARGHALVAAAVEPTLHDILTGAAWHSVQR